MTIRINDERELLKSTIIPQNDEIHQFILILVPIFFLSAFSVSFMILSFLEFYSKFLIPILLFFILPLLILFYFTCFIIFNLIFSKLILTLINLIHPPKEGVFLRSFKDRDFLFFCGRKTIKNFVFTINNYFPLPWVKNVAFNVFNMHVTTNSGILDSYIDSKFVTIGKNTILGEGSMVLSFVIFGKYILVKSVKIGDNVTIGNFSIVAPGTIIENDTILGMGSYTKINQHLTTGWIYTGQPVKKLKLANMNQKKNI